MKNVILTAAIVASTAGNCFAQFNFKSALKSVGSQVQRQVTNHVQREVQRHVSTPKYKTLPHPTPKPCPKPIVKPLLYPIPHPQPTPKPCPIKVYPQPAPPKCVIKPAPPHVSPPKCVIHPTPVTPVRPITPVVPVPTPVTERPQVKSGQQVTIDGRLFGPDPGKVVLQVGGLSLNAQVTAWSSSQVTAVLPQLPIAGSARATVVIKTSYNHVADKLEVNLLPGDTPVSPTPVANELPKVTPGQTVTLDSANIGTQQGRVQMEISGLTLNATVKSWSATQTTATLPAVSFDTPVKATIKIVTAGGQVADQVEVMFTPATNVAAR